MDGGRLNYEPAPIRIFVVWHPRYVAGEATFGVLYDWLGGQNGHLYHRGLGVPVQAWTSLSDDEAPGKIPHHTQDLTIIVPILDGEFLGRKAWRDWVMGCMRKPRRSAKLTEPRPGGSTGSIIVLPWAVHQAAASISGVGVLHLLGSGDCDMHQLCRRVTEACVARIRNPNRPRPSRIFISYARQGGSQIASKVRSALQAYGNLSVFLDDHDLQPGVKWRDVLASEFKHGAAMFAIVTDAYASRAWCREELRQFREPRRDDKRGHWYLRPVYILDSLSGTSTRSMFEVGNAPAARWTPERASEVVDQLIREMLFAEVNRAAARRLGNRRKVDFINWVPDTWTLLQVLRSRPKDKWRIAYPGDGLPRIELERLTRVFPDLSLVSFEELKHNTAAPAPEQRIRTLPASRSRLHPPKPLRPPVLLSLSNPPRADLSRLGMRDCHLDAAAIRIAHALLANNYDVMYGGLPREGFTKAFQDDSGAVVLEARLINYLGWPHTKDVTPSTIADGFGITRYAKVDWSKGDVTDRRDPLAIADAATHTRKTAVSGTLFDQDDDEIEQPRGLIALGGQLLNFAGFMPGVAEEIAIALEARLAVYVLGGFGGAAEKVAKVMSGKRSDDLTRAAFEANPKYIELSKAAEAQDRVGALDERIDWLTQQLKEDLPDNGLSPIENEELWTTSNLGRAVALISKGLSTIGPRNKKRRRASR
jgi:SLOG-like protein/TIR domain-containing protein